MATPRAFWKGYLKLSLVTCPVAMMPAVSEEEKVRFHTLNRKTGDRVRSRYIDSETGKEVDQDDEVKGYQRGDDDYVTLEDDEIQSVALESTRTIDIDVFAPKDSIEWIWYDRPHFLMPDDPVGEEAFSVIRDAMEATKMVGISRLVLYRRERAVLLEPRDRGIVLWTLHYGDEVRDPKLYFKKTKSEKVESKLLQMVESVIDEKIQAWNPNLVQDPVQEHLLDIIAAKKKGRRLVRKSKDAPSERQSNVISIMDALKKSLDADGKRKKSR